MDVQSLSLLKKRYGSFKDVPAKSPLVPITNAQLLQLPVDILIPAALEDQITAATAPLVQARVVLEMANGPTSPEADVLLAKKDTIVVPDVLANTGGVVVSYFEWYQNLKKQRWPANRVADRLRARLVKAATLVHATARKNRVSLRTAAFLIALNRIYSAGQPT